MLKPSEFLGFDQRWLPCQEVGGLSVPAFGALEVVDVYPDGTLQVQQPTGNSLLASIVINGPTAIDANGYGSVTRDFPAMTYATGVATGQCGTVAGSYVLSALQTGFWALGAPTTDYPLVMRCSGVYYLAYGLSSL